MPSLSLSSPSKRQNNLDQICLKLIPGPKISMFLWLRPKFFKKDLYPWSVAIRKTDGLQIEA